MEQKTWKMAETLASGYSSEKAQRELSNEYQHDRVWMVFKRFCILVLWTKVAPALEGLMVDFSSDRVIHLRRYFVDICSIPKLFLKVSHYPNNTSSRGV